MQLSKEVAMAELDKGHKVDQRHKKFLWFGYGNYGAQPNLQIGGGNIRNPDVFEELFEEPKAERSSITFFMYVVAALIGLTVFAILFAWGISLVVR
jgi:hypothetical protein